MEAITKVIVTALTAGTTAIFTETAKIAISDAYAGLKYLIVRKLGEESGVVQAIKQVEDKPASKGRHKTLNEQLEASDLGNDPEIMQAVEKLQIIIEENIAIQNIGQGSIGAIAGKDSILNSSIEGSARELSTTHFEVHLKEEIIVERDRRDQSKFKRLVREKSLEVNRSEIKRKTSPVVLYDSVSGHDLNALEEGVDNTSESGVLQDVDNGFEHEDSYRLIDELSYDELIQETNDKNSLVEVFFATDRNLISDNKFGSERSDIKYGLCEVSIPCDHGMGELESPSFFRLELKENLEKHVVLVATKTQSKDKFFSGLSEKIRNSQKKSAFIFIHGYNVSFEDAARRTGQMAYDLSFDGAPIFYSWPSHGNDTFSVLKYTRDEQNIEWTQANLMGFLVDFFSKSDAENTYLIAHSMGNRALTNVISSLIEKYPDFAPKIKEIILTAPDIDAEVFKRDIVPAITAKGNSVTLYASSEDLALVASKFVHGNKRAGDSKESLIVVPQIETIDATSVNTSFLGHSYYADNRSALSDMFYLIKDGFRASQRFGLDPVDTKMGRHWVFKKG